MGDGTLPHETRKFTVTDNDRYSIIFFMIKKSWMIPTTLKNELRALGYNPPKSETQCEQFKRRFQSLTDSRMFYQCELSKRCTNTTVWGLYDTGIERNCYCVYPRGAIQMSRRRYADDCYGVYPGGAIQISPRMNWQRYD